MAVLKSYKLKITRGVMIAGKAYQAGDTFEGPLTPGELSILLNRRFCTLIEEPKKASK